MASIPWSSSISVERRWLNAALKLIHAYYGRKESMVEGAGTSHVYQSGSNPVFFAGNLTTCARWNSFCRSMVFHFMRITSYISSCMTDNTHAGQWCGSDG